MPDLRRGGRQSKKIINTNNDDDVIVTPTPRRGTHRGKAQTPKAPMPRPAGRGRGGRATGQDKNVVLFGGLGPQLNLDVALRDQLVVGKSAEKNVANGEEEGSTSAVPERVVKNPFLLRQLVGPAKVTMYYYNVKDSRLHHHMEQGKNDGLYVSCVASSQNLWAIIMDAGTGFTSQVYEIAPVFLRKVVELDFLYPSEGIHRRWENGYRITSAAATEDQAAFILSTSKRRFQDVTQETLGTTTFPC